MLQLRTECAESLQNLLKTDNSEIVTCIFDTNIQFEQLNEMYLLPKDVMRIVYEYFNDKIIVNCSVHKDFLRNEFVLFDINDNNNKITYHYYLNYNILIVPEKNLHQNDDSITIIPSSNGYFNLSRLYYHYIQNNDSTFEPYGVTSIFTVDNNKYTITTTLYDVIYVSVIRNHKILRKRIAVMKQLIDIIKKLPSSAQ